MDIKRAILITLSILIISSFYVSADTESDIKAKVYDLVKVNAAGNAVISYRQPYTWSNVGTPVFYDCNDTITNENTNNCVYMGVNENIKANDDAYNALTSGCWDIIWNMSTTETGDGSQFVNFWSDSDNRYHTYYDTSTHGVAAYVKYGGVGGGVSLVDPPRILQGNGMHLITSCVNSSTRKTWIDGVLNTTAAGNAKFLDIAGTTVVTIGAYWTGTSYASADAFGGFKEAVFYDEMLTDAEVLWRFNSRAFNCVSNCTVAPGTPPTPSLTLNTKLTTSDYGLFSKPTFFRNNNIFVFWFNGTKANTRDNNFQCKYYLNNTLNQSKFPTNISKNQNFSINVQDWHKGYWMNVTCNNTNTTASFKYNVYIDVVKPISQIYPIDWVNNTVYFKNISASAISLNITWFDTNLLAVNKTLRNSTGANITKFFKTNITTYYYSNKTIWNLDRKKSQRYSLTLQAWDDHNPIDTIHESASEIITTKSDSLKGEPATASLAFKSGTAYIESPDIKEFSIKNEDNKYTMAFDLEKTEGATIELVGKDLWELRQSEHKAHFVSLPLRKYFDLDSDSIDITGIKETEDGYVITFNSKESYVKTNSIGDLNYLVQIYYFNVTDPYTITANDTVSNTLIPSFTIKVLNATTNITVMTRSTSNKYVFLNLSRGLYKFNFSSSDVNPNSTVQTITPGGSFMFHVTRYLWICGDSESAFMTYNFSLHDEDNFSAIKGDISVDLTYSSQILTYQGSNVYSLSLCKDPAFNYTVSGTVYSDVGYQHKHFMHDVVFTAVPQYVWLYNFRAGRTDLSTLQWISRDYTYTAYKDLIVKLQRYYPLNHTWYTIQEDSSGEFGNSIFQIHEADTDYKLYFYNNNSTLLDNTDSVKFVCDQYDVCYVEYQVIIASAAERDIHSRYTYNNNTHLLQFSWNDPTGATSDVSIALYKVASPDNIKICNTTIHSSAGSYTCNATGYTGSAMLVIRSSGGTYRGDGIYWIDLLGMPKLFENISGAESSLWSFGFVLVIAGLGLTGSPIAVIIGTLVSLWINSLLGLSSIVTVVFLGIAAVVGFIIAVVVKN